jgi:hypothetical protein
MDIPCWLAAGICGLRMADDQALKQFRFRAFVSYSHRDQKTALWLHKALENYRIPKDLHGSPGRDGPIPKQLFPIFRDRDELSSSSDLSLSIREALDASACLIVLCSPAAARSRWVNQEIITFIKLGRRDRIHTLIVDGDPAAMSDDERCFPPALHATLGLDGAIVDDPSREVVAADLRPEGDGKDDAKLKLIAGILGIPFNALRRREVAAARKRHRVTQAIAGAMALLILAIAVAGWSTWYFRQESDERQIPGLRVESRETVLDLSGWQETTAAEVANLVKKSSAFSRDRYTIVRTQLQARNYVHIVGTSSGIPPEIGCTRCEVTPRYPDDASRAPNEFKVVFDISNVKLEDKTDVEYTTKFWNAFQTPDQWWAGLRVLYQTETATFSVIFPKQKHPKLDKITYAYHDTKDHPFTADRNVAVERDEHGQVSRLTWIIPYPSTDRSYRVYWDWNDGGPAD